MSQTAGARSGQGFRGRQRVSCLRWPSLKPNLHSKEEVQPKDRASLRERRKLHSFSQTSVVMKCMSGSQKRTKEWQCIEQALAVSHLAHCIAGQALLPLSCQASNNLVWVLLLGQLQPCATLSANPKVQKKVCQEGTPKVLDVFRQNEQQSRHRQTISKSQ